MTNVVLYGNCGEKISNQIEQILKPYGTISILKSHISIMESRPKFILTDCGNNTKIECKKGIIVIVGDIADIDFEIPNGFIGITNSLNTDALKLLKNNSVTALTCGMSGTDTLVLSGISENSASVCLQRKITALNGASIEPAEYPLHLKSKITEYAFLAAFGVLLLSGTEPKDLYY